MMASRAFTWLMQFLLIEEEITFTATCRRYTQYIVRVFETFNQVLEIIFNIARCHFQCIRDISKAEGIALQQGN